MISGDSMQIYRGMDIGTAKVTKEEQQGIPHHLIDIRDPDENYSAADFQADVEVCVRDITSRGKLPVIAGGTGLYIQAALYGYDFSEAKRDDSYQQQLEQEAKNMDRFTCTASCRRSTQYRQSASIRIISGG